MPAGDNILRGTRHLRPMTDDPYGNPRYCWRRKLHPGSCRSKKAYLKQLERGYRRDREK